MLSPLGLRFQATFIIAKAWKSGLSGNAGSATL